MTNTNQENILHFNAGLGQRLRILRQSRKMSQKALGAAIGLSFQQIQKYENGTNRMTVDRLIQVSRLLNVRVDYFLGEEGSTQTHTAPAGLSKIVLCLAGEVLNIPDMEVQKSLYHLIRTIGKAINQNEVDVERQPKNSSRFV